MANAWSLFLNYIKSQSRTSGRRFAVCVQTEIEIVYFLSFWSDRTYLWLIGLKIEPWLFWLTVHCHLYSRSINRKWQMINSCFLLSVRQAQLCVCLSRDPIPQACCGGSSSRSWELLRGEPGPRAGANLCLVGWSWPHLVDNSLSAAQRGSPLTRGGWECFMFKFHNSL